jgi:hypothetical protein
MLPPETTATIGPGPAFPVSAAASDNEPAPSAMTRAFSASMRIASLVCSRLTTIAPSTTGLRRSHMRGKRLWPPAPSTNDAFQSWKTCGDPIENDKAVGAAVSGSTPQILMAGFNAFKALPYPGNESTSADGGDDGDRVRCVLENFESHGAVARDEVLVVEGMHKRPGHARIGAITEGAPRRLVGHRYKFRAEGAHSIDLCGRRRLDRDDRAGDARQSGGVGHALAGVAGTDCPHSQLSFGLREHRYGIDGTAKFVGVRGLQILELEADVWEFWPQVKTHERRAHDAARNSAPRILHFDQC